MLFLDSKHIKKEEGIIITYLGQCSEKGILQFVPLRLW